MFQGCVSCVILRNGLRRSSLRSLLWRLATGRAMDETLLGEAAWSRRKHGQLPRKLNADGHFTSDWLRWLSLTTALCRKQTLLKEVTVGEGQERFFLKFLGRRVPRSAICLLVLPPVTKSSWELL